MMFPDFEILPLVAGILKLTTMLTPEQIKSIYPTLPKQFIESVTRRKGNTQINRLTRIAACSCDYHKISMEDFLSSSQKRRLVDARAIFVVIANLSGIPPQRSAAFINRDRTTAIHLLKKTAEVKEVAAHIPKVIKML